MMPELTKSPAADTEAFWTYSDTVARGLYDRPVGGLRGKYDNVRTYWEDRITRLTMGPFVAECAGRARLQGRKVRILDLGSGAGQAYGLLTHIDERGLNVDDAPRFVLPDHEIDLYLGVDLSMAMVEQGRRNYADVASVRFEQADLRDGLAAVASEPPFDIYVSSYGSLSHLDASGLARCLTDVLRHAPSGAVVVLDLVGRYSPEWPGYWQAATDADHVRPYSMSYLYEEGQHDEVERFPLRFWTGEEIRDLCVQLTGGTGITVEPVAIVDRSIFVGRHLDTQEYGCRLPPLRRLVNRLYEQNVRTRLEDLHVDHRFVSADETVERFFLTLAQSWNRVLAFTRARLSGLPLDPVTLDGWRSFPRALQEALVTMDRVVAGASVIDVGDTRANLIEPQLAYVLQRLEDTLQEGLGCGHGLLAVLRIGPKD
jgi:SAM-dependent methyltransferase